MGAAFFACHFVVFDQSEEPKVMYAPFGKPQLSGG